MATTSDIDITEGGSPTAHVATFDITEDTETKKVQRIAIADSAGADLSGTKGDAADTHTDTTAISWTSIFKQISKTLQAAAGAVATAFFAKVTDGTNTAAVKAASTAPAATDPALVVAISPNSVNVNGQATMAASAPVVIASNQSAVPATISPATSGGLSRDRYLVPSNTTNRIVKATAGQVYKIRATNNSSNIGYLKLYDAASATAGSGTPVDTIMIPGATAGGAGIADVYTDIGAAHATGITYIVTSGYADNDTTAPAANAFIVTVFYK